MAGVSWGGVFQSVVSNSIRRSNPASRSCAKRRGHARGLKTGSSPSFAPLAEQRALEAGRRIMNTELRQLIEQTLFHQAVVRRVIEFLPVDDAALDELLTKKGQS
jgi:hypothetical protein